MTYRLSQKSQNKLQGVHPDLVAVVHHAIAHSKQDFAVIEGLRSLEKQKQYLKKGTSRTLQSQHLLQSDGYGHAVDLAPYVNGSISWDWQYVYPVAEAMREAALALNINIRWGGNWQILNHRSENAKKLVADYVEQRRKQGKTAFLDGVHFEIRT